MRKTRFLKYGGVRFRPLVKPQTINRYVRSLPAYKRDSMYEVAKELQDKKMIDILPGEMSTSGDDSCL